VSTNGGVAAQSLARHAEFSTTLNYIHATGEVKRAATNRAAVRPATKYTPAKSPIRAKNSGYFALSAQANAYRRERTMEANGL